MNPLGKESQIKNWAKAELNIDVTESEILDLIQEHKFFAKLLTYTSSRVLSKRRSKKYINYAIGSDICKKLEDNNQIFQNGLSEIDKRLECLNSDDPELDQFLKLQQLFQLATEYESQKTFEIFDQNIVSEIQLKNDEIKELLQMIEKYCHSDSIEALCENYATFNKYLFETINSQLNKDHYDQSIEQITEDISLTLKQISDCFTKISHCKINGTSDKIVFTEITETTDDTSKNLQIEFDNLKALQKNWILLQTKVDEKISKMKLATD